MGLCISVGSCEVEDSVPWSLKHALRGAVRGQPGLRAKSTGLGVRVAGLVADSLGDLDLEVLLTCPRVRLESVSSNPPFRCMILSSASVCPP